MHAMQCHACNDRHVYRNNTQDAAKKDSKLFSSGDLVDVDVSLNRRGKCKRLSVWRPSVHWFCCT